MCTTNKIEDERGTQLFDNKEPYEFNICNDLLFDITIVFARNLSENTGAEGVLKGGGSRDAFS